MNVLVAGLSLDSAFARVGRAWTNRDEMFATHLERQDMWGNYHAQMWGAKKPPAPIVFEHPDRVAQVDKKKVTTDPGEIARFFGQLRR